MRSVTLKRFELCPETVVRVAEATRRVVEADGAPLALTRVPVGRHATSTAVQRQGARLEDAGDLLTVDEVAALLQTTRKAIYARVERDQIPGVMRVGRSIRFRRAAIVRWLERAASSEGTRR